MAMTRKQVSEWARKHLTHVEAISDYFIRNNVSPQDGENILLWCAGLSKGARQAPANTESAIEIYATAWQIGAEHGDDFNG